MKRTSTLILLTLLLIGCSKAPIVNEEPNPTPPVEEPVVEVFRSVFSGEVIEEGASINHFPSLLKTVLLHDLILGYLKQI